MTTFNTTACKVKVNGQWTPLLAIGGSGGGGAHIAVYGETTYDEISEWLDAGEWCVCKIEDDGFTGYLYPFAYTAEEVMFCIAENEDPEMILKTSVSSDDVWGELEMSPLQITANLIGSYEDWISDPTLYPSTTAVEEYVEENAGGGGGLMVHFSGSGSSVTCDHTVAEIVAAAESGSVTGELNDNVYHLSQYGSSYAIFIYNGDYDYGGEDYYILSSNFGSNTWTLTEKFKADIYDIQDEDGNSLIDDDHIAVIPAGGGGDIEWATYGTTTSAQLETWYQAGKTVLCNYSNYIYVLTARTLAWRHIFSAVNLDTSISYVCRYLLCFNDNWTNGAHTVELHLNKIKSTDTWTSDDTKYPSAKAVEQYVAGHAGGGPLIVWTEEGTNAEIYSAWSSGRAVIAKDTGGVIYNLVSATSTKAEFSRVTTRSYSGSALSEIQVEQQIVENDTWKHLSGYFSTN